MHELHGWYSPELCEFVNGEKVEREGFEEYWMPSAFSWASMASSRERCIACSTRALRMISPRKVVPPVMAVAAAKPPRNSPPSRRNFLKRVGIRGELGEAFMNFMTLARLEEKFKWEGQINYWSAPSMLSRARSSRPKTVCLWFIPLQFFQDFLLAFAEKP